MIALGVCMALMASSPVLAQIPGNAQAAFSYAIDEGLITTNDLAVGMNGYARIAITEDSEDIQVSNFGWNSFTIKNMGDKRIAAVFIDVTNAVFADSVFDSDGRGGDHVAKMLTLDTGDETGPVPVDQYQELWLPARDGSFSADSQFDPNGMDNVNNLFVDQVAENSLDTPKAGGGFRGQLLLYTDFWFDEMAGFSSDMDPNSLAGLYKETADAGADWDVGGVAGSELVGSVVTVLFGDGTSASSTIASDGSQSGGVGIVRETMDDAPVLNVDGYGPGQVGSYTLGSVGSVTGAPGSNVRVSVVEGFDPVVNRNVINGRVAAADLVRARLEAQYPDFPVSNALEWSHVVVTIPSSGSATVSNQLTHRSHGGPLAFVAVAIDANGDPISTVSDPIRLVADPSFVPVVPAQSSGDDGGGCFSGQNTVDVHGKGLISMDRLQIGDRVLSCSGDYSLVYSFFHRHDDLPTDYLRIVMNNKQVLEVTANHLVYANGLPVRAADVKVGDGLSSDAIVVAIERNPHGKGLYAPVTWSGDLVVSGACSSSYVALWEYNFPALQNWATHMSLAVTRLTCSRRSGCQDENYDVDTGFATRYTPWITFIAWLEAVGGKGGTLLITLLGAPFLILLYLAEQTRDRFPMMATLLAGGLTCLLLGRKSGAGRK